MAHSADIRVTPLPLRFPAAASRALCTLVASLCVLLATAGSVDAQRRTSVGITGGATIGDLYGGGVNTDTRWGGTVGVTAAVRNLNYLVTQLEVNWVQKGGEDVRLDYIEIPLLFGGVAQTASGRGARAYTGIGVAFPIGCSADGVPGVTCDLDRNVEWAWPFGLQIGQWLQGGRMVAVDVRYSLGLTNVFDPGFVENRSWQFRLIVGSQR